MTDPFRRLTYLYARAVDRGNHAALCEIFTKDGRIHGPGFDFQGAEGFETMFAALAENFEKTQHRFFNQLVDVDRDRASGETYALACHIIVQDDGSWKCHDWAVRYQDTYERNEGRWKFKSRELVVDWTQTGPASPLNPGEK